MNQETLEHLYVTGNYSLLLEEINKIAYNQPSSKCNDIEKAICVYYHSSALIRLGKVNKAENLINKIIKFDKSFTISSLINQTSLLSLQITQGKVSEALENGLKTPNLIEEKKNELSKHPQTLSFWSAYLYYWIGIGYFYQFKNDLAKIYFQKSLSVNQTNLFVKGKCLYYMAFLELEKGEISSFFDLLEKSLEIYQTIDAKQGIAWITAWQGQYFLQKGDFQIARSKISQASELFGSISDLQGTNLVNSLVGLMYYQQGRLTQAKHFLEDSFKSSIEIGNPMIASYCLIPLILLYIESRNRSQAENVIQEFKELNRNSTSDRVKVHYLVAQAIFLKSSSRFYDKAQAQRILKELLNEEIQAHGSYVWLTSDTTFSFLIIIYLAELYIEEFKLSEDNMIMREARSLIDNHIQSVDDQKYSPELIELSLLKAKLLIIEGEIEKALEILENVRQVANTNNLHRLEEKIGLEINRIDKEFTKWDAAISVRDRIKMVEIEKYLKEVQKMQTFNHQ